MINADDGILNILPSHLNIKFCIQSKSSPHSSHKKNARSNDAYKFKSDNNYAFNYNKSVSFKDIAMFCRDYANQINFIFEETSRWLLKL